MLSGHRILTGLRRVLDEGNPYWLHALSGWIRAVRANHIIKLVLFDLLLPLLLVVHIVRFSARPIFIYVCAVAIVIVVIGPASVPARLDNN